MKGIYISRRKVIGDEWLSRFTRLFPLPLIPALRPLLPAQSRTRDAGEDLELKISTRFLKSGMLYIETSQSILMAATCCLVDFVLTLLMLC